MIFSIHFFSHPGAANRTIIADIDKIVAKRLGKHHRDLCKSNLIQLNDRVAALMDLEQRQRVHARQANNRASSFELKARLVAETNSNRSNLIGMKRIVNAVKAHTRPFDARWYHEQTDRFNDPGFWNEIGESRLTERWREKWARCSDNAFPLVYCHPGDLITLSHLFVGVEQYLACAQTVLSRFSLEDPAILEAARATRRLSAQIKLAQEKIADTMLAKLQVIEKNHDVTDDDIVRAFYLEIDALMHSPNLNQPFEPGGTILESDHAIPHRREFASHHFVAFHAHIEDHGSVQARREANTLSWVTQQIYHVSKPGEEGRLHHPARVGKALKRGWWWSYVPKRWIQGRLARMEAFGDPIQGLQVRLTQQRFKHVQRGVTHGNNRKSTWVAVTC